MNSTLERLQREKDNLRTIADRDLKNITKLESQRDQLADALGWCADMAGCLQDVKSHARAEHKRIMGEK